MASEVARCKAMWRRKGWLIFVGIAGLVVILLWANWMHSPAVIITWHAPYSIAGETVCDLDGDGDEELFVYGEGRGHLLRIRNGVWQEEEVPIMKGWELVDIGYPSALAFKDQQDFLWLLRRSHVWQLQKLVRVQNWLQTDLDDDGLEDDLLVFTGDAVYWYELQHGSTPVSDWIQLPKESWVDLSQARVERGKLHFPRLKRCPKSEWEEHLTETLKLPDIDGDGKEERMFFLKCLFCRINEVTIELSRKGQKEKVALPFPVQGIYRMLSKVLTVSGDFDGNGQKDFLAIAYDEKGVAWMLRFERAKEGWQCEAMRMKVGDFYHSAVVRVGNQDWLFTSSLNIVEAFYRTPKGWRRQRWQFKGNVAGFWQDDDGLGIVTSHSIWLVSNPLWDRLRLLSLRLKSWSIPIPVLPYSLTYVELWRWHPKQRSWRKEAKKQFSDIPDLLETFPLHDLNGDGQPELLIIEDHSGVFGALAYRTGKWLKRWQLLKLWGPRDYFGVDYLALSEGKRQWLVIIKKDQDFKRNFVQALTLK